MSPTFSYVSGNPSNLTPGGPASMTDIQGPLTDLRSALNGNLDEVNVPNLSAAFTTWKHMYRLAATQTSSAGVGIYAMFPSSPPAGNIAFGTVNTVPTFIMLYLDPTDFNANTRTTKLRVRAIAVTNNVAPAITFTIGLYPVATFNLPTTQPSVATLGTVVTGSTAAIASPSASALSAPVLSTEFNFPAAGAYVMGVATAGTPTAGSVTELLAFLEMRQV